MLPVWPADQVSASGSDSGLVLLGETYALGDRIEVGGGFAGRWDEPIPDSCRALDLEPFIVSADQ
ncbi:MAG TPA: hypothetical protein VIL37_20820 [Natronosporangium sp.]